MEEKKTIKISLSTFFLILAIIVIVIMGVFIFKFYNDKKVADSEVKKLESTIDTLEGKINSIEGTLNNNANNNDTIKDTTSKTFSNDEIKKTIQKYLDLTGVYAGSPGELLSELGFKNYREDYQTEDYYRKTNIKYAEYKNRMLNYMTEEWFENNFEEYFKDIDGYLYYFNGGASGMKYEVESVNTKGNLSYIANAYYIDFDGNRSDEPSSFEFSIADYNGKCVISYCNF